MALTGNLSDLDVADLIQLNCQSGARARLTVQHDQDQLTLYFDQGQVVHAQVGNLRGEQAVYQLLSWDTGEFAMEQGIAPPMVSIQTPWSALVMEGMRLRDEQREFEKNTDGKESNKMAPAQTRAEQLKATLRDMVDKSLDIKGVVVITLDGLIVAAALPADMEQGRVGAVAAGIMSLSRRSVDQLRIGSFERTMVQANDGNLVLTYINKDTAFVALTGKEANLGMVFLELRDGVKAVSAILG